jgi:hypothetical protein
MGKNVVPNAVDLYQEDVLLLTANLMKLLPHGINIYPIGSAGQKPVSSDADFLIDSVDLMTALPAATLSESRKKLEEYFKSIGLFSARTGVSVHVGIPIGRTQQVIQVDLMAVANAKEVAPLHQHDYSNDPTMKGGTLHAIWADLARMSSAPGHKNVMISPYRGLVDRETKEFITSSKDAIAKIIIGPSATSCDMRSVSAIIQALTPYTEKFNAITKTYCTQIEAL